ncbi:cilia- and flagella-associated protein 251-like [Cyprinus carpio]|uniref:Cilia- and flagella-associated protein 251-like n=1 Tax=Cyprinus carpio TaxID=7962 RepID=A0A9Q9Y5F4_CYPCA|nr:cilia- and flagella-associated protein 251-like [Cyprinus carpio]
MSTTNGTSTSSDRTEAETEDTGEQKNTEDNQIQLPVLSLQDEDRLAILYICAHVAVMYDHTSNSQHLLQGHCSTITCLCASEDRRWLVTADMGQDSLAIIWDAYREKSVVSPIPVRTLFDCHPEGGVSALALSKDSKYLVTLGAGAAQRVCVWNLTDESESPECQVDLSPKYGCQERRHLEYSVPEITDQTFNMVQGSLSQSIFYYDVVQAFTATSAGNIVLWDKQTEYVSHQPVERKAIKLVPLQKEAITVLILTDSFIVTGNVNGQIKFYDGNLKLINVYNEFSLDPIRSISFSKEKASISGLGYPKDLHTGCQAICHKMTVIHKGLEQHEGQYMILIFWRTLSLNYDFVLSTTHATAVDVNAQRNVPQTLLKEHTEPLEAVACHPKQPLITMGSHSGTIKIWDYECKEAICSRVFRPHKQILCITYDPQDFVYLFMMVCFGPSYGFSSEVKDGHPTSSKDDDPNSRYMADITTR